MEYTEQNSVVVNLLPYADYEAKYWAGELTENEAWIPTDLVGVIPTRNTDIRNVCNTIKATVSSFATLKSGAVAYVKQRTSEVAISVERISASTSSAYVYTIIAEVGSTPYTISLVDLNTETNAVLKWKNGDSLYNSSNKIQLQANTTYLIRICNGLASYDLYS